MFNFGGKKTVPAAPAKPAEPLKDFAGMYEALAKAQAEAAKGGTLPTIDPKALGEAISKAQIAPQVTAEQMAAVQGGGEAAVLALNQIINQSSQASVMQSIMAAQKMMEASTAASTSALTTQLPQLMRDQLFQQQLQAALPNLTNPALSPLVETVRAGLAASNPTLTPEQLTGKAVQFFTEMSGMVAPAPEPVTDTPAQTNFFELLGVGPTAAPAAADPAAGAQ